MRTFGRDTFPTACACGKPGQGISPKAREYKPLIIPYRNGSPVRVSDVADVVDSVEDLRNAGYANGKPSVLVTVNRQPGANIIDTVDQIRGATSKGREPQTIV
jgi:multidrug efflux pump subunit AcrB